MVRKLAPKWRQNQEQTRNEANVERDSCQNPTAPISPQLRKGGAPSLGSEVNRGQQGRRNRENPRGLGEEMHAIQSPGFRVCRRRFVFVAGQKERRVGAAIG